MDINSPDQVKYAPKSPGCVEIIFHSIFIALPGTGHSLGKRVILLTGVTVCHCEIKVSIAVVDPFKRALSLVQTLFRKIDGGAVVRAQEEVAKHQRIKFIPYVSYRHEIAKGFRHLFFVDHYVCVVEPVFYKLAPGSALRLSYLVFVVGEYKVAASAVDIYRVSKILSGHCAAFDVPARSAVAPRALPERLSGFAGLPERKIKRIVLSFIHFDPCSAHKLVYALF